MDDVAADEKRRALLPLMMVVRGVGAAAAADLDE